MAKTRRRTRRSDVAPETDGNVVALPRFGSPSAGLGLERHLDTVHGPVSIDFSDPCAPVARADLDAGAFAIDGCPFGVEARFDWSETTDSFAVGFSSKRIVWDRHGGRIPLETAFAAVSAIQDSLAILCHEEPRMAALAKSRTLSIRLERLDAELATSPDPSRTGLRAELAERTVAARRAVFADVATFPKLRVAA